MVAADEHPVEDSVRGPVGDAGTELLPPPRLLGMFDPVLHGWADRTFLTGAHKDMVTSNGMFRATALIDGRVAGVWTMPQGVVTLKPLKGLTPAELAAVEAEASDVLRYLALPLAPLRVVGS